MKATDTNGWNVGRTGSVGIPMGNERGSHRRAFPRPAIIILLALAGVVMAASTLDAQYFGRNRVRYESFDFKILSTEHFDVHYYPEEEIAVRDAARMIERWYDRLSGFFGHQLGGRTPLILYANQGDFQQTHVIGDNIGEGTGGFTEPLKDRIVLPLTGSYAANDHVIGHELVHAFQYDIVQGGGRGTEGLQKMYQLPLWFIEGMAEYLSIGRVDPNTAMWLRDDVAQDKVPTLEEITSGSRYFPYRYGQAIWAYIGGRWGDDIIPRLYQAGLDLGWEQGIQRVLGVSEEEFSNDWIAAVKTQYSDDVAARKDPADSLRRVLAPEKDAGGISIGPSLSPDGRTVAFLASDLFSIDLYLADAQTGEMIDKLLSTSANPHLDALRFINSAGAWSQDGKKFATVVYSEGDDQLAIIDIASRDIERTIRIPDVGELSNPSWAPDGSRIVFSGSSGGISDLYIYEIATGNTTRLMSDRYADFQPVWSPDGNTIAFSSDRGPETDFRKLTYSPFRLALIDVRSREVRVLPLFPDGKNINPQYSPDGRDLYFISNRGGISDVYRYTLASGEVHQVTDVATGVSGITEQSPALTVARTSGRLMYSVFDGGSYVVSAMDATEAQRGPIASETVTSDAGILPPTAPTSTQIIAGYLRDPLTGLPVDTSYAMSDYSPSLKLDYIGTPTVGVSFGGYGTGFAGGISAYFSDMLGYHNLAAVLQANGGLEDIGGQVQYMYTRNRWGWGVGAAHIPFVSSSVFTGQTTVEIDGQPYQAMTIDQYFQRVFQDQIELLGEYPFSTTQRFEVSAGFTRISYSLSALSQVVVGNTIIAEVDTSFPAPDGLNLLNVATAYVGDNSFFGFTSPIMGQRYRLEVGGTAGSLRFGTLLADYRRYFFANPFTFAVRGLHYGRYGPDAESDRISPLFLGYESNVRGYSYQSFDPMECTGDDCPEFNRLLGSRMVVANAEVRVPLFGVSGYGLIDFPFLPTELTAFADGGLAWSAGEKPTLRFEERSTERVPVFSAGVGARFNVFGYLVLEVFYAYPFQRPDAGWQWGFQIAPGW